MPYTPLVAMLLPSKTLPEEESRKMPRSLLAVMLLPDKTSPEDELRQMARQLFFMLVFFIVTLPTLDKEYPIPPEASRV
jgi:hypothetical protein